MILSLLVFVAYATNFTFIIIQIENTITTSDGRVFSMSILTKFVDLANTPQLFDFNFFCIKRSYINNVHQEGDTKFTYTSIKIIFKRLSEGRICVI